MDLREQKEDIAANVYAYGYPLPEIQGYEIKITNEDYQFK